MGGKIGLEPSTLVSLCLMFRVDQRRIDYDEMAASLVECAKVLAKVPALESDAFAIDHTGRHPGDWLVADIMIAGH